MVSKYRNTKCEWNGEKFDSKRELARYQELLLLQKAGKISELERQVVFVLAPAVRLACKNNRMKAALRFVADFRYRDILREELVTEDCKGMRNRVYEIKRHLLKAIHGIDILET
jgi:hypothetical protein